MKLPASRNDFVVFCLARTSLYQPPEQRVALSERALLCALTATARPPAEGAGEGLTGDHSTANVCLPVQGHAVSCCKGQGSHRRAVDSYNSSRPTWDLVLSGPTARCAPSPSMCTKALRQRQFAIRLQL